MNIVTIVVDDSDGKLTVKNFAVMPADGSQPIAPAQLLQVLHLTALDILQKISAAPAAGDS